MTPFELLSTLVSVLAVVIAFIALLRARDVASRQIELQERQLALERESAKLARLQREQLEAATRHPPLAARTFAVKIHYEDATIDDTVLELTFENTSSLNRSINNCTIGVLDAETDLVPKRSRQARYQDKNAEYPVAIPAHSSLILYAFGRHLRPLFEEAYGASATESRPVATVVHFAGMPEPLIRVVARFSLTHGLSAGPVSTG